MGGTLLALSNPGLAAWENVMLKSKGLAQINTSHLAYCLSSESNSGSRNGFVLSSASAILAAQTLLFKVISINALAVFWLDVSYWYFINKGLRCLCYEKQVSMWQEEHARWTKGIIKKFQMLGTVKSGGRGWCLLPVLWSTSVYVSNYSFNRWSLWFSWNYYAPFCFCFCFFLHDLTYS